MEGFANTYIVDYNVFKRLASEIGENTSSCTYNYDYYTSNVCDYGVCSRDYNCESNCCSGNTCSSYWCDRSSSLDWLWWLLSFLFLFCCIASSIAHAKRRRRQAELMHHLADSHNQGHGHGHVDVVYYNGAPQQPGYAAVPSQPGYQQPMMGQPVMPG